MTSVILARSFQVSSQSSVLRLGRRIDNQGLRDCVLTIHKRPGSIAVSPAKTKAKMGIAHKPIHTVSRGSRVFCRQTDELYLFRATMLYAPFHIQELLSGMDHTRMPKYLRQ
jgi:hypothetical protein